MPNRGKGNKEAGRVRAVVEVKGDFESSIMNDDFQKMAEIEKNPGKVKDCSYAFVGFSQERLSIPARRIEPELIKRPNHFLILPGVLDSEVGNKTLKEFLDSL
jgi:hypothetical protein